MTIQIPVRFLLFVLYTAAILGGAVGISYAVFEWRDEGEGPDGGITLQSLDSRIDSLSSSSGGSTGISRVEAQNVARSEAQRAARYAVCVSLEFEIARLGGISEGQVEALSEGIVALCEGRTGFTTQ